MKKLLILIIATSFSLTVKAKKPLETVDYVDLNRYMGKWYALKSLPQIFTIGCKYQTAEYKLLSNQEVSVLNTCIRSFGSSQVKGVATVDNAQTNADLSVQFKLFGGIFRPKGDYKILALDEDYQYVLVGSENLESLWLMSRDKTMPDEIVKEYILIAKEFGFKTNELVDSHF